jgi:hypothetical protein
MSNFDSYKRTEKAMAKRETDKGKYASDKASPDAVSQGMKRKLDAHYVASKAK